MNRSRSGVKCMEKIVAARVYHAVSHSEQRMSFLNGHPPEQLAGIGIHRVQPAVVGSHQDRPVGERRIPSHCVGGEKTPNQPSLLGQRGCCLLFVEKGWDGSGRGIRLCLLLRSELRGRSNKTGPFWLWSRGIWNRRLWFTGKGSNPGLNCIRCSGWDRLNRLRCCWRREFGSLCS